MCSNFSVEIHKAQLLMASQEQATATNSSVAAAATNLSPSSVSSPSNSQTQLTSSLVASVPNATQLQQLHKSQQHQPPQVTGQAASATVNLPYNYTSALAATGYSLTSPQYGLTALYDPKSMVAVANKLKMLPTAAAAAAAAGVKLDRRYTPY